MKYNQFTREDINAQLQKRQLEMIGEYINAKTPTEFICYICNRHFMAKYEHVKKLKHNGCSKCSKEFEFKEKRKQSLQFRLSKLESTKSDMLDVISYDYDSNSVNCLCLLCHKEFITSYESICIGSIHKTCASKIGNKDRKISVEEIETRVKQRGYDLQLQENKDDDAYLFAHCNKCGYDWAALRKPLCNKGGCPVCCKDIRRIAKIKKNENWCLEVFKSWDLQVIGEFNGKSKPIDVRCNVCGKQFRTTFNYQLASRSGCPDCKRQNYFEEKSISFVQSLSCYNSHIIMIGKYSGIEKPTSFYCDVCNQFFTTTPHDLSKKWNCPNCTTNSVLETKTKQFIMDCGLNFETHKRFDGLIGVNGGMLSYDFYLPQLQLLIECQGQQHVKPIEIFGGESQFTIQQEHDKRKREYAEKNHYRLIEVFYYDVNNIEDILKNAVKVGGDVNGVF